MAFFLFVCFAFFFFLHNSWRTIVLPQHFITVNHGACPGEGKGKGGREASRISKLHQRHPIARGTGTSSNPHSHSPVNSQSWLESYFFYIHHGNEKEKKWLSNKGKLEMRLP